MKRTLMALAGVLAMATGAEAWEYETIRVGVDSPYPPFEFTNPYVKRSLRSLVIGLFKLGTALSLACRAVSTT